MGTKEVNCATLLMAKIMTSVMLKKMDPPFYSPFFWHVSLWENKYFWVAGHLVMLLLRGSGGLAYVCMYSKGWGLTD